MKNVVFLLIVVFLFEACKKEASNPSPSPQPEPPKPTITLIASPSTSIGYGDSVTVSYTSTNAGGASGSTKMRPLQDSTIYRTVVGVGGSVTGSIAITVAAPDAKTLMLTGSAWRWTELKLYKESTGTWIPYNLDACQKQTDRTFYLNFREYNDHKCFPTLPPGYGWTDWYWKSGPGGNRDSLYWGGPIYGIHLLTPNKLVLRENVKNIPGPGTTLTETVYER